MANPLFNRFGNNRVAGNQNNGLIGILNQYKQIQNDPGKILDVLLNNGKISQQQYNDLQPMRNNPQQIVNYLSQHGNADQINRASQLMQQFNR